MTLSPIMFKGNGCTSIRNKYTNDIEDIYSFAVTTINIFIKCNESISIFTSAKHE